LIIQLIYLPSFTESLIDLKYLLQQMARQTQVRHLHQDFPHRHLRPHLGGNRHRLSYGTSPRLLHRLQETLLFFFRQVYLQNQNYDQGMRKHFSKSFLPK
jgi:hypothetical protein